MISQDLTNFDKEMGAEDRLSAPPDFSGPVKDRKVTDPLCLLLLLASWGAMTYLGIWSIQHGNVLDLVTRKDYMGRHCGKDLDEEGNVLPPKFAIADLGFNGVCVNECPSVTDLSPTSRDSMVCKSNKTIANMTKCVNQGYLENTEMQLHLLVLCGACMYDFESKDIFNNCIPIAVDDISKAINSTAYRYFEAENENPDDSPFSMVQYIQPTYAYVERFAKDLWIAWNMVLGIGVGGAIVLGMLFLFILRVPGFTSATIWISAVSVPIILGGIGYGFMRLGIYYNEHPDYIERSSENIDLAIQIASYIFFGLAGIVLLLLIFLRKRIALAIGISKAAARSVVAVPLSVFFPLLQLLGWCTFMVPWSVYFLYLASIGGDTEQKMTLFEDFEFIVVKHEFDYNAAYGFWYLLFCLYWSSQFIVAVGQIVLSMCYSKWYFTVDKEQAVDASVFRSTGVTLCKHAGTAAFGSLVIAIIQLVRTFVLYTQKKIKQAGADNKCVDVVICCCQCCLFCLERCMKFVSKNAYIQTAIFGHSFCKGAHEAFYLILRNAARMAAVGLVSELSMWICKLFIVGGCCVASFYGIQEVYPDEVTSVGGLVVAVAFLSWFIADMFTEVLGIAISTIIQCFIADEEMFSRTGSYFVPKELDDFLKSLDEQNEQNAIKSFKQDSGETEQDS